MRPILCSALLFACAVAGPMDRGSISPGGQLGLVGSVSGGRVSGSVGIAPGVEYAVARGIFVGADVFLAGGFTSQSGIVSGGGYIRCGLHPVGRFCLAETAPWPFVRLQPSVAVTSSSGSYTGLDVGFAGSVGLLTMLSHGVALEPALFVDGSFYPEGHGGWSLTAGIGVGLRSYIYK